MDVGLRHLRLAARADRPDDVALADGRALHDGRRAKVDERDGIAVARSDRHRPAADRHGAGEGDDAGRGRAHGRAGGRPDVDAPVLAAVVGALAIEAEWS